jgi:glycosyltransferase involved in cell wall biosynthesis
MNSVGLSMIVRDAAQLLPACLASAKPVTQEIVVADTGSTDATISIAESLGARVLSIPWRNDFAEARNACLAAMTSDWILSLDADEILDSSALSKFPSLLASTPAAGFQVTIRNYVLSLDDRVWDRPATPNDSSLPLAAKYPAFVEHQNVRLFRRAADVYFVGRVHESVGPRLVELGRKIARAPFFIHHFGLAASAETRERKNHLYRELGRAKIHERPQDAQAHFELGLVEMDNFGNVDEALLLFQRASELNPRLGVAWFFRGLLLLRAGRLSESLQCLAQAERHGHATALVAEAQGDAHYNSGDFASAVKCYRLAIRREPDSPFFESKLGLARVRSGDATAGLRDLRRARDARPAAPALHDRLVLALVSLGLIQDAAEAAEAKLSAIDSHTPSDFLRTASLWAKSLDPARAAALLQVGLQVFPHNQELQYSLDELARSLGIAKFSSALDSTT